MIPRLALATLGLGAACALPVPSLRRTSTTFMLPNMDVYSARISNAL